jgi:hypothetical protein
LARPRKLPQNDSPSALAELEPASNPLPKDVEKSPVEQIAAGQPPQSGPQLKTGYVRFFPTVPRLLKPPKKFFDYWAELDKDQDFKNRLTVYGYRLYPVIDMRLGMPLNQRAHYPNPQMQVMKVVGGTEAAWTYDDFLHRLGAGSYRFKLNDSAIKTDKKTWTEAVFEQETAITDQDHYPAVVDPKTVVWDHPANATYARYLREHGQAAGAETAATIEEEEDEMANTAVIEKLTESMQAGQDKLIDMAEARVREAKERNVSAPITPVDNNSVAERTGIEMMKEVVTTALGSMRDVNQEINKVRTAAAATAAGNGTGSDPASVLDTVTKVIELVKPNDNTPMWEKLFQIQREETAALREELKEVRKAAAPVTAAANPATPANPFEFMDQALSFIDRMKAKFASDEAPAMAGGMGKYERWMTLGTSLLAGAGDLAGKIAYGIALGKSGAATAPANPGAAPNTVQQQAAPGLPPGPPRPPLTPEQEAQMQRINSYRPVVALLEAPLLRALDNARSGDEFAQSLIDLYGASAFRAIRDLGATPEERKQNVVVVLSNLSPRLRERMQQAPQQFEQFLDEFLGVDLGGGEEEEDETPEGTTPAA